MEATVNQSAPVNDVFKSTNAQLPIAGKIRPGIMVLTKAAKEKLKGAEQVYAEGISVGASFDVIEKNLKLADPTFTKKPLTPRNCESFRCNQDDFNAPGAAQSIIDLYGEDRGQGVQLYTFPVVFPVDNISLVFRQKFESWTASELKFWSEYGDDGAFNCMRRQEVKQIGSRRRFGGRPKQIVKPCDPNSCDVFAAEKCNHNCSLSFYVPGAMGVGLIELGFSSIYAALQIQQQLDMVMNGLGRIKGVHNQNPIFHITKSLDNVSRVDYKNENVTRANQYIIKLEAVGIDMTEIFKQEERRLLGLQNDTPAAGTDLQIGVTTDELVGKITTEAVIVNSPYIDSAIDIEPEQSENPEPTGANELADRMFTCEKCMLCQKFAENCSHCGCALKIENSTPIDPIKHVNELRKSVFDRAKILNLTTDKFGNWGVNKYGVNAFKIIDTLERIEEDLTTAESTGDISQFVEPEKTETTKTETQTTTQAATKKKAPF